MFTRVLNRTTCAPDRPVYFSFWQAIRRYNYVPLEYKIKRPCILRDRHTNGDRDRQTGTQSERERERERETHARTHTHVRARACTHTQKETQRQTDRQTRLENRNS